MDDSGTITERVIEQFGGIRPMAAKLDTPVTTVQGWKKRGIIPQPRHAEILAAAARENIAIDAAELAATDPTPARGADARPGDSLAPSALAGPAPMQTPPRARTSRVGIAALLVSLILLVVMLGGGFAFWQFSVEPLRARVARLESRKPAPDDLTNRLAKLEAEWTQSTARPMAPTDQGSASAGSGERDRLAAIEQQLNELKASASDTEQLGKRLSDMQLAAGGRELLAQSIRDIQSSSAATQGAVEQLRTQLAALGGRLDQVDTALAERRRQSMRAEAIILGVGQLRSALRGAKPFAKELASVRTLIDGDTEMQALIDQMQPFADEGAPTIDDLTKDFGRMAPDIVRNAVVGDGQNWWRQALFHLESVISIRRIGSDVPGDETDAIVARAEAKLDEDDVSGAVAALQQLKGLPSEQAAPWIHDANKRIAVDTAEAELTRIAIDRVASGSPQPQGPNPAPAQAPAATP
jgi:hypothetical protein